jgi:hypothetical protein
LVIFAVQMDITSVAFTTMDEQALQTCRFWHPSDESLSSADRRMMEMPVPDLHNFSAKIGERIRNTSRMSLANNAIFEDALYDLSQLLDEIRIEHSLAVVYITALRKELLAVHGETPELILDTTAKALLTVFQDRHNLPSDVFLRPKEEISGERILGGWFAGQLFDSAIIRCFAVLDRIMIMMACVADVTFKPQKSDPDVLSYPSFNRSGTNKVALFYENDPLWKDFVSLLDDEIFKLLKRYRNGFMHSRRYASQLHGEHYSDYLAENRKKRQEGAEPSDHEALPFALYMRIVCPAMDIGGKLIQSDSLDSSSKCTQK